MAGCAAFSVPMTQAVVPALLDGLHPSLGVELGRFVLLDEVEANGKPGPWPGPSRYCAKRCRRIRGVVSYCDPEPRYSKTGDLVKKGHVGTIYRAHNATPRGRSKPRTLLLAPDRVGGQQTRSFQIKERRVRRGLRGRHAALDGRGGVA